MLRIIIFYFSISTIANAQANYEITYSVNTDLIFSWMIDGEYRLNFNQQTGNYYKPNWPAETKYVDKGEEFKISFIGDPEGMPVYTDLVKGTRYYKSLAYKGSQPLLIKDTIHAIAWELIDSTKQIGEFIVHLARGEFSGRIYSAWYTLDIPVALGPFKLGGLPGLILEAISADQKVEFKFKSFTTLTKTTDKLSKPPEYGNLVAIENMMKYMTNRVKRFEALSTSEYTVTIEDPLINTYIENDTWTFITRVKEARGY